MNPFIRNFLFSNLESQMLAQLTDEQKQKVGKLLSVSFICEKNKFIQRVKFELKSMDMSITDSEANRMSSVVGYDIHKELESYDSIFIMLLFSNKTISIQKNKKGVNPEIINL